MRSSSANVTQREILLLQEMGSPYSNALRAFGWTLPAKCMVSAQNLRQIMWTIPGGYQSTTLLVSAALLKDVGETQFQVSYNHKPITMLTTKLTKPQKLLKLTIFLSFTLSYIFLGITSQNN